MRVMYVIKKVACCNYWDMRTNTRKTI